MFTKIIAFSLALIPFYCWQGWDDGIRTPKEIASIISLAVIVVTGFCLFNIRKAFNKYFFAFFGWCVVTLFLSSYAMPLYFKEGVISLHSNLIAFKSLFYIALALLSIQVIYSSDVDLKLIAKTITIVSLITCVYVLLQFLGLDEWFRVADPNTGWVGKTPFDGDWSRRLVGTLGNPSILGIFLSICLPFCLFLKNKLGAVTFVLSLVVIGMTLSLTAYVATIFAILFILFFRSRNIAVVVFTMLIVIGVGILQLPQAKFMLNPTGRIEMLKESFDVLQKKAITGYGLGSFQYLIGLNPEVSRKLHNENWREAHNEYFQVWFEVGLVGLILLLMGIFTLCKKFLQNIREETVLLMASFLVFLIVCLTYFPMRIAPTSFYGVIILGLLMNKIGEVKC